jgi:RNA polymerase sigma factor (TIGR02999 family)
VAEGSPKEVTQLLKEWSAGSPEALEQLIPLVYKELHRLAQSALRRERSEHTLQSTALVHEAYLRLVGQRRVQWQSRAHFFAVSAQLIRRILVDYARKQHAAKRGDNPLRLTLDESVAVPNKREVDLVALDDALGMLANLDPQQCRIVELRFFAGLSVEETAEVVGISTATVKRDWAMAKAWLYQQLHNA